MTNDLPRESSEQLHAGQVSHRPSDAGVIAQLVAWLLPWWLKAVAVILLLTGVGIGIAFVVFAVGYVLAPNSGRPIRLPMYPGRAVVERRR